MLSTVIKRDGREAFFDISKIVSAISKAMEYDVKDYKTEAQKVAMIVAETLDKKYVDTNPTVEEIQDCVEKTLMKEGFEATAKRYILYRAERTRQRETKNNLYNVYKDITFASSENCDLKRENANINGDSPMGAMLRYGSEGSKDFYMKHILSPEQSAAHIKGDIHIHDLDFYTLTLTCCQIDLDKLFSGGFSTGEGFLREPNSIQSYAALACIAIQANQNDQHGGQSIPNFDYNLARGVLKSYKKIYISNVFKALILLAPESENEVDLEILKTAYKKLENETGLYPALERTEKFNKAEKELLKTYSKNEKVTENVIAFAIKATLPEIENAVYQSMESLVHNLNTMHSRAGAQVPFSSINYGTDTSPEGRMIIKNLLLSTEKGLGKGETPIFPIQIFKVKEGVNYNPGDPNYDLYKLAMKVSAKRLFPNFSFIDAPFNLKYYKKGRPETEIAYMGCRTRVVGNVYDPSAEIVPGRGNLSFTTINLPRIALNNKGDLNAFFCELDNKLELVKRQLLDRFEILANKSVFNFPFLMGQGVWIDSEKLKPYDKIREVMKHGTLSIGFFGLAEALVALIGKHHGESKEAYNLGYKIIKFMRDYTDKQSKETGLNFTVLATPAEGLAGRFVKLDRKIFGEIPGVTDREFYTNSFHIPVYYQISAFEKIKLEAPFHELTNAGHITYIELDGDTAKNIEAFESIIRFMKENNIGYGAINHPIDRDPVCGYNGIIDDECPFCRRKEYEGGYEFERIRRITGYLVGTVSRFNNAKRAEVDARVKHQI